jgi:hypothetical protein
MAPNEVTMDENMAEEKRVVAGVELAENEVREAVSHYVESFGPNWFRMQHLDVQAKLIAAYWYKIKKEGS